MSVISFYLDTNILIYVRQWLVCEGIKLKKQHFPANIKHGLTIDQSLSECRSKHASVEIITSRLSIFEMNRIYKEAVQKQLLLAMGLPLEAFDGRYFFNNFPPDLPPTEQQKLVVAECRMVDAFNRGTPPTNYLHCSPVCIHLRRISIL